MSTIAVPLRTARTAAGLSQGALARAVGMSRVNLCRLEADGPRDVGLAMVRRLAGALPRSFVEALFPMGERSPTEVAAEEVRAAVAPLVNGVMRDVTMYGRARVTLPARAPRAGAGLSPGQALAGRLIGDELPRSGKDRRWRWTCASGCGASGSAAAFNLRRQHACAPR